MTEQKTNNPPEIEETEQKTFESEPISVEELNNFKDMLYGEDFSGGLQNIQVSEEELERQRESFEYAQSFIDMKEDQNIPCYRTDQVTLKLTPEQLVVLKEALETLSVNMVEIPYLEDELGIDCLYKQQSYVRMLRDNVDDLLNEYVRHRPYSAFIGTWVKKIGKDEVAKDISEEM